ncbi:hypothetical protein DFA_01729 [Cavenderia fasciculata]|uniref:F-box domain-containing protein n=1 Tax=Cavenderia fasciculata TaxID=261658 RepID=F4PUC8_CACFS|nr:uncharacterized protein DFA_01729 [Cavenderia fasciculata]EGG21843.1 hypothetical protein DFA_01729 [Cavenderia fasciculata]|eukprot:XP_004359693.1 hypothetical protein DFA_01729 [Cavenderia fasciculata]
MFLADNIIIQIIKSLHDIDRISFVMTCHKFWRLKAHLTFYCFPNKTITIQQLLEQHRLHGSNNVTEEILYNCITPPTANISNVVTNDPSSSSSTSTSSSSSIQKRKGGTFNLGSFQDNYIKSILYTLVVDDSINAEISGANGGLDSEEKKFDQPIHQYHIPPAIEILKFGADLSVDNISSVRFPTTLKTLELFQYPFTQDELNQLKKASSSSSSSSSTTTSKKKSIATKFLSIFKKKKKDIVVAVEEIQPQPQPQQPTEEVKEIVEDEIIEEIVEDETKFKFKLPNQLQSFTTSSQSIPLIFNHLPKSVDTLIIFFIDKKGNNKKKDVTIKFPATIPSHIKNIELHVSSSQANFRPYFPVSALTNIESLSLQNPFTKVLKCRRTGQDHLFVLSSEIEDSNNGFISIKENESKNVLESFQFSDYSWLNEFFV